MMVDPSNHMCNQASTLRISCVREQLTLLALAQPIAGCELGALTRPVGNWIRGGLEWTGATL